MQRIVIRGTDLQVSAAGLGCVGLTSLENITDAAALLERAFDSGITHFDVARAYGGGRAEQILGRFLANRRKDVTVTTKFGIAPPAFVPRNASFVSFAKRLLKRVPIIERRVRRYAQPQVKANAFGSAEANSSLEQSLRALGTDHVDVLLLHEGTLADTQSDDLLDFLSRQVDRGTIRFYGVGSNSDRLGRDLTDFPSGARIFQFENDALGRQKRRIGGVADRGIITHSALKPLRSITEAAQREAETTTYFQVQSGFDLKRPADVSKLLLEFARSENENGVVLFGSTRVAHVTANVQAFSEPVDKTRVKLFLSTIDQLLASAANSASPT